MLTCLLCGSQNPYGYQHCSRCGIVQGRGSYHDIPKGFASCRIVEESIEVIDNTHERAHFLAEVCTAQGVTYPFHSVDFIHEKWDDDAWREQTADEKLALHELADILRRDGWLDVTGADGSPTNIAFWRRTE